MRPLILATALVLVPAAAIGCGSSGSGTSSSAASSAAAPAPANTQPQSESKQGCTRVPAPSGHKAANEKKPSTKLDPQKSYTVTVETNCGTFAFKLDVKDSPHVTSAFAGLVKRGFFDGLTFHRIVPNFVIQGGDPSGNGTGGPGFSTADAPPSNTQYSVGTVAMAKTQTEPKGTAGSQFFVVTGSDAQQLTPDYALLGKVTKGLSVVEEIGRQTDPSDPNNAPTQPIVMKKVTVSP